MYCVKWPTSAYKVPQRLLRLQRGDLHLALAPTIGGSIAEFFHYQHGMRRDILRPATAAALGRCDARAMASFPMLPFCNRIRHSVFSFDGKTIHLIPNLPPSAHAIHGIAWQVPWQVLARTDDSVVLSFDYGSASQMLRFGWPWGFYAEQEFQLNARGLCVKTRLQNRSKNRMPFGIGHHPYFPKTAETILQIQLTGMWTTDAEILPIEIQAAPVLTSLAGGVRAAQLALDNNFVGWNREVLIRENGAAGAIRLSADSGLDFLGLYQPAGEHYFCVEPVSMCTDAFNLASHHALVNCGGQVLLPDESIELCWELHCDM